MGVAFAQFSYVVINTYSDRTDTFALVGDMTRKLPFRIKKQKHSKRDYAFVTAVFLLDTDFASGELPSQAAVIYVDSFSAP